MVRHVTDELESTSDSDGSDKEWIKQCFLKRCKFMYAKKKYLKAHNMVYLPLKREKWTQRICREPCNYLSNILQYNNISSWKMSFKLDSWSALLKYQADMIESYEAIVKSILLQTIFASLSIIYFS